MRTPASGLPPRIVPVGREAEDTVQAIVLGEVDSVLVEGPDGPRVYTLAGAEEPYRLLVERMCEAAVVLSEDGVILYCNSRLKEWLAIGGDDLCGHRFEQLVARGHRSRLAGLLAAAGNFPAAIEIELMKPAAARRQTGATIESGGRAAARRVRLSATRLEFDDQPCFALVATDLSGIKRSERMATRAAFAEAILEQATQAIIVFDLNGVVTHASRAATALCDAFPIGQPVADAFPLRPADLFGRAQAARLPDAIEASLVRAGKPYVFLAGGAPLYDPKGAVVGCVLALTDITALKSAKDAAEQANDAKTRFLASVSHDIRQPLQAQRLLLSTVARQAAGPVQARACELMEKTLDATESMLSRLMDFAALESGNVLVMREVFRLDSLVLDIIRESSDAAAAKGLKLARRVPPCWTDSDPVLLRRILGNLIANACRYTDRGGLVVAVRRRGGQHRIEVWDTGIGIAPDQQQVIFEEFRQLDNPERNRTKGHGLGLAIVAKTAELLGHRLFLRSVAGRGSVFAVEVPQAEARAPPPECVNAGTVPSGGSATILVVEDDPVQADALDAIFSGLGYHVMVARDPAQAMAPLPLLPDLIISDYRLPGQQTGVEVVAHIRQAAGRPIPAIIMTGDTQATVAREAGQAGCAIVHKPCTFAALIAAIDRALPARPAG